MVQINIDGVLHEITEDNAAKLIESGALIEDADYNTYALNPDHDYTYDEVKMLLVLED